VGQGILLQSKVTKRRGTGLDIKINTQIEESFNRWADNPKWCDAAGKMTFWKMQKAVLLSVMVSGEILVRIVKQKFDDSPIPFALELIEADQLDDQYTVQNSPNGNHIRMGVEVDRWKRPVAYWVRPYHPGDIWQGQNTQSERIPASEILHIFNWRGFRPGQTRGVPALHSVITQSRNLLGYQESEVVKARIQSCIGMFFENEQADDLPLPTDDDGYYIRAMEPGMIEDLPPGKRLASFDPSSPNPNMTDFVKSMQRGIARGLNTSSYLVSGDLADANYSSMRIGLLQQRKQFEMLRDDLNEDLNHKVFVQFVGQAAIANYLRLPADYEYNAAFYIKDCWIGESWPWVDPLKDTNARRIELEMGTTSQTRILAEKGIEIEEFYAELAREQELRLKYGIVQPVLEPIDDATITAIAAEPEQVVTVEDVEEVEPPKRLPRKRKKQIKKWA
jgi:lambda family phage portal protein